MTDFITIKRPEILHIRDPLTAVEYYGANQLWYDDNWKKRAGCGPTACAHIMWYLSQTVPEAYALCSYNGYERPGFLKLMDDVWEYVTPTTRGVNKTEIFINGAVSYGRDKGFPLACESLEIGAFSCKKQRFEQVREFILNALRKDVPVGFLNLSNGEVKNLDNWHWVTLVGMEKNGPMALMYDQCNQSVIDMRLWCTTTLLGGGLVSVMPFGR
ncbi:MAG: hypothetical protein LBU94_01000 [Clostridiales bacterium]|jgi:hypothetical protein|nr:hypothetical protein [Clostridiales bacterium]